MNAWVAQIANGSTSYFKVSPYYKFGYEKLSKDVLISKIYKREFQIEIPFQFMSSLRVMLSILITTNYKCQEQKWSKEILQGQ